jgi:Protein of unknown function (DUF1553)/Protein of unknown function (DUF1549)/Bacterial Ig-like domain (group 2)
MFRTLLLALLVGWLSSGVAARAGELRIFPPDITLSGPHASQRLLVLSETAGKIDGDHTARTRFTSSNPSVATVDEGGMIRAAGDGDALITATEGEHKVAVHVRVTQTKSEFTWSFTNHVIPVLTKLGCNSGACHGALAGKGGLKLSLRGFAPEEDHYVLTRQALGRRVNLLEPAQSLMLRKPTLAVAHGGGLKLEVGSPEYQLLADWIASGAPGPRGDDATIRRLEVFPTAATLKPGDTLQVIVRAWYSDGHSRDVTRWARFNSTEDLVAAVDENGTVRVAGHGEMAISVWYSNCVASCRVASPLPNSIDPQVFARASRHNAIDDLVLKKLQTLHIPPSPDCTEAEFIRRVYLDAAGILPTPEEVRKFLADSAPDRRARLIDALLERPEFVDYWTYKWSDLLLISSRKLPQPAVWAFHQYVRRSVADNKPWNQFAREILTARGNNLQHGEANYFVLHKDLSDLTEATAVTFLGMSVTCCRCHNHPLEKWTQDQYWSMANLFARVVLKNGDRTGEVAVLSQPTGEALHPRRGVPLPPAPLDAKPLPPDSSVDRRQYFAAWLTAPENPYFARALVNRVLHNYLGRGLVEAEDDLRQTNPPSNEELFDALAKDFNAHHYDVKHLMRTILNSATYQRSSTPVAGNEKDDRFYSHYLIRRLPAEVILDAYSQVTGVPTVFNQVLLGSSGGVGATNAIPPGTRALQLPDPLIVSPFLDAFGRPERSQTCSCERQQESSVTQALHLDNGKTLNDKLRSKCCRVERWVKEKISDDEAIARIYVLTLCRTPTVKERQHFGALLAEAARDPHTTRREALEDLFWAVLTGREFLFNR